MQATTVQKLAFEDIRTTVVLPYAFDRNLQVLSVTIEKTKNDIIKEAIQQYLEKQGLNPSALPRITVTY